MNAQWQARSVRKALEAFRNKTVQELTVWHCIDPETTEQIAEAIKHNTTLTTLNLYNNQIGDEGAKHIAEALKYNKTLTTLDLWRNHIGAEGAKHIAEALKYNKTLTTLNLTENEIGDEGAKHIAEALKHNKTLKTLTYVFGNNVGDGLKRQIDEMIRRNENIPLAQKIQKSYILLKRSNLLVLGDSGAGKTSLLTALQNKDVDPDVRKSTDTLEIASYSLAPHQAAFTSIPDQDLKMDTLMELKKFEKNISLPQAKSENKLSPETTSSNNTTFPFEVSSNSILELSTSLSCSPETSSSSDTTLPLNASKPIPELPKSLNIYLKHNLKDSHNHVLFASDFGGQEDYRHSHSVFLQRPGLFVVCINLREANEQKAKLDDFLKKSLDYWVYSVAACSVHDDEWRDSIFIVGTHLDTIPTQDALELIDHLNRNILERYAFVASISQRLCLIDDKPLIVVDNTRQQDETGINEVRKRIYERLDKLECKCPAEFVKLDFHLRELKRKYILLPELLATVKRDKWMLPIEESDNEVTEDGLKDALKYFVRLGSILYYPDVEGDLSQMVILSPNFIVGLLQQVINVRKVLFSKYKDVEQATKSALKIMIETGKITEDLLEFIWNRVKKDQGLIDVESNILTELLVNFHLCFEQKFGHHQSIYWCPALFASPTRALADLLDETISSSTFAFSCSPSGFIPSGFFSRLLSVIMTTGDHVSPQILCSHQVELLFKIGSIDVRLYIIQEQQDMIAFYVQIDQASNHLYSQIYNKIEAAIDSVKTSWYKNLEYYLGLLSVRRPFHVLPMKEALTWSSQTHYTTITTQYNPRLVVKWFASKSESALTSFKDSSNDSELRPTRRYLDKNKERAFAPQKYLSLQDFYSNNPLLPEENEMKRIKKTEAVGLISASTDPNAHEQFLGTGFLESPNVLVTNVHVLFKFDEAEQMMVPINQQFHFFLNPGSAVSTTFTLTDIKYPFYSKEKDDKGMNGAIHDKFYLRDKFLDVVLVKLSSPVNVDSYISLFPQSKVPFLDPRGIKHYLLQEIYIVGAVIDPNSTNKWYKGSSHSSILAFRGYEMLYAPKTIAGMSASPCLNLTGDLLAIHRQGYDCKSFSETGMDEQLHYSAGVRIDHLLACEFDCDLSGNPIQGANRVHNENTILTQRLQEVLKIVKNEQ